MMDTVMSVDPHTMIWSLKTIKCIVTTGTFHTLG